MITKERHLPLDQRREVIHVVRHVEKARLSVCREGTCMRTGILNAREGAATARCSLFGASDSYCGEGRLQTDNGNSPCLDYEHSRISFGFKSTMAGRTSKGQLSRRMATAAHMALAVCSQAWSVRDMHVSGMLSTLRSTHGSVQASNMANQHAENHDKIDFCTLGMFIIGRHVIIFNAFKPLKPPR